MGLINKGVIYDQFGLFNIFKIGIFQESKTKNE